MKLHYDAETERFREELAAWLAANCPSDAERVAEPVRNTGHMPDWARAWQRKLFDAGLLVPGWPPELGGRNATPVQQLVYFEEVAKLPMLRSANLQGLTIIAPSIVDYGNDEQKERFVLPTLRAEITWCLGMSEPGAGSDLAGLTTRAERHGDTYVVNGQKVWTSGASDADYCFCFVRTNPDVPKHRGISVLIIDMQSPGIDARPLPNLIDRDRGDFCQVYLDNVEVPAENLVGEENHGWAMAAGSLAHERGMLWTQSSSQLEQSLEALRDQAQQAGPDGHRLGDDPVFRDAYASLYVDAQALRFLGYEGFGKFAKGEVSPEHSLLKLLGSEVSQRLALTALQHVGPTGLDVEREEGVSLRRSPWAIQYLFSFANTIAGGTSEIQRNIIAQRVLGLPRS